MILSAKQKGSVVKVNAVSCIRKKRTYPKDDRNVILAGNCSVGSNVNAADKNGIKETIFNKVKTLYAEVSYGGTGENEMVISMDWNNSSMTANLPLTSTSKNGENSEAVVGIPLRRIPRWWHSKSRFTIA
ncbi:PREDICTED: uncharacterized protein LOC108754294 [Trachymyrmex septentrionalis]|uniref:uncharacterized protein LOC108754294 n=1 Tax=Trachymyrmex septentrionalis TaxID=34720 RepID=UPI00084F6431|nr:PREDICTED: uncharacterized protein LOC108754294 [Trachymyrmex septentrionalis]